MPSHDVLIIGAGLAGQRAALAAAQTGATVAIISKVHPVRSHSVAAAGGINAALNPEDTWESHAFDTIKGSDYLGDQDAIEAMAEPFTQSNAWFSGESSSRLPSAALMPPCAAPEWLRTGCILETIATSAPRSAASTAARMPARPPPTTTMSCLITFKTLSGNGFRDAPPSSHGG